MPCNNKFQHELTLEHISYEPTTLIVGTIETEWPAGSSGEWFYGKTANNCFWDVLPRLYGEASLINGTPEEWKQFCYDKRIAITNLISAIDDAEPGNAAHSKILSGLSDKAIAYHFDDLETVPIVQLLQKHPSIRNVYLTRGIMEAFWRHIWNPVMQYCSRNDIHERRLLTPIGHDLYEHSAYNEQHPATPIAQAEDYILMRWQEEWHF